jgi:chromosome segregation ATPase
MKDIADLLEEIQDIVQTLREEKMMLEEQLTNLGNELTIVEEAKKSATRDLQEMKVLLGKELQAAKEKLDQMHPEMQSLQNDLQNAEVQNNLLAMDLKRKDAEIKKLEVRLHEYTSLIPPSFRTQSSIG